jgi:hypothetical protein
MNWPSWSDRPLIMRDVENKCNLSLATKRLSTAVLELFWVFVATFAVCNKLYVVNSELRFCCDFH